MRRFRKAVIQIPCYNEAQALPITLAELPRTLPGVDVVEWLVVDDSSTDGTADVAIRGGVDHLIRFPARRGLAAAFAAGLDRAIAEGADLVINTDGDNQYRADDIPLLVAPIARGEADMVVGARPIGEVRHFSPVKRLMQRIGSWTVRVASGTEVADAPSGFRAMSRDAAMRLHVMSDYTYTLETIIQAGRTGMTVVSVPVRTNPELRPSRLVRSTSSYVRKSALTIVRIFMAYKPFRFFALPGLVALAFGTAISTRFLTLYFMGEGQGHIQSLILSALLIGIGFFLLVVSLVADLLAVNRKLQEETHWRVRQVEERLREMERG
jgi:glycosyltransferase involved in cell wall biosynthesis